jgi:hypothetical protein
VSTPAGTPGLAASRGGFGLGLGLGLCLGLSSSGASTASLASTAGARLSRAAAFDGTTVRFEDGVVVSAVNAAGEEIAGAQVLEGDVLDEEGALAFLVGQREDLGGVEFDGGADGGQAAAFQRKMNFATIYQLAVLNLKNLPRTHHEREKLKFLWTLPSLFEQLMHESQ